MPAQTKSEAKTPDPKVVATAGMLLESGTPKQRNIAGIADSLGTQVGIPAGTIDVKVVQIVQAAIRRDKNGETIEKHQPLKSRTDADAKRREKLEKQKARLEEQRRKTEEQLKALESG